MATENKSIKVHPALEQTMIDNYELFGWNLMNSQEIHTQTSHSDEDDLFVYHYTTTTNYVKLQFSRDKEMENREKILPLETEFWDCFDTYMSIPKFLPGKIIMGWTILYTGATVVIIAAGEANIFSALPFLLVGLAPALIRHFLHYLPKKKKGDICKDRCAEIMPEVENM
ncbi:MAG: hypothetical protein II979_05530 [Clostridia bacterium]|nr:hypothetical protein [Clostridia bacterium]